LLDQTLTYLFRFSGVISYITKGRNVFINYVHASSVEMKLTAAVQ